ncbi:uncharacterized protein SAPINGB_P001737 [Magnusiomyces paraingens]|uniref:PrpF protein n=1 Tax=Magnusiomyces paraingens TaxID=2606893 RepID=A0A5E8B767_9ASCO|nr:uncharacterized protein SAPINGB_P001737 [Saprochaete ingens]VVT47490.1 unnamed protein product [Saprochaete ingens]
MSWRQRKIPLSIYRGGTSRALFFHKKDIPVDPVLRDKVLKRAMGTPDPDQIDGLGSGVSTRSKVAIISKSNNPGVDIEYTFAQIGIADDTVDYDANCGNISSAVGPFSIDEGLVSTFLPGKTINGGINTQLVRIFNTGTQKMIYSHVPINSEGIVQFEGDFKVDGVPGNGAPILIDWKDTVGASRNLGPLPTGNPINFINVQGVDIPATICDVGNIAVFAKASDFGLTGSESRQEIDNNLDIDRMLRIFRSKAAELVGMTDDWKKVVDETPFTPFIVLLSSVSESTPEMDIQARLILKNHCHPSLAASGAICIAACSRIPGTVLNNMISKESLLKDHIKISHLKGSLTVWVETGESQTSKNTHFEVLAIGRTARKILDGYVYIPETVWES